MNCIRFFSRQTEWVPSPRTTCRFLWRAASFCTERYAPMPLTGEAPVLRSRPESPGLRPGAGACYALDLDAAG